MSPEKMPFQTEVVFQPSFFQGYVSFQRSNMEHFYVTIVHQTIFFEMRISFYSTILVVGLL